MAKDKKGKGSGSKDACYHKVKSRYSVWPSAYASGALVKCRKVGAANWGNSTKKEEFEGQVLENVGNEPKLKPGSGLGGAKPVYPNDRCQDSDNITLIIEALESGEPLVIGPPEYSAS